MLNVKRDGTSARATARRRCDKLMSSATALGRGSGGVRSKLAWACTTSDVLASAASHVVSAAGAPRSGSSDAPDSCLKRLSVVLGGVLVYELTSSAVGWSFSKNR